MTTCSPHIFIAFYYSWVSYDERNCAALIPFMLYNQVLGLLSLVYYLLTPSTLTSNFVFATAPLFSGVLAASSGLH